jgi:hypothetical protein
MEERKGMIKRSRTRVEFTEGSDQARSKKGVIERGRTRMGAGLLEIGFMMMRGNEGGGGVR